MRLSHSGEALAGAEAMPHAANPTSMATNFDDDSPTPAEVDVRTADGVDRAIDALWITRHLRAAVQQLAGRDGVEVHRVNALVVDDARMTHLHERHSGIAETTDVLTFDLRDHASKPIEADIVACADVAARSAAECKHSIEQELLLYFVHGLLHCAGYNDHAEADWRRMHAREDEILQAIGVGATFRHAGGADGAWGPP